jgi:hypothetical protein
MSEQKLKPCPFCGGSDLGIGRGTEGRGGYPTYVYCGTCGAQGPWIYTSDRGIWTCTALACEQTGWNKRAGGYESPLQKAYREVAEAAVNWDDSPGAAEKAALCWKLLIRLDHHSAAIRAAMEG